MAASATAQALEQRLGAGLWLVIVDGREEGALVMGPLSLPR